MPFGVEIPDNINETIGGQAAPEKAPVVEAPKTEESAQAKPLDEAISKQDLTKEEIVELEKLLADRQKFKFNGQELTLKDLKNQVLMRQDYTKKTQELAETRKFVDNFDVDLKRVIENPSLMAKFKEIYPAEFARQAESILKMVWKDTSQSTTQDSQVKPQGLGEKPADVPPEFLEKFDKLERLEKWMMGQEQSKAQEREALIERQLDDWFSELSGKYKYADPDAVVIKAQALADADHKIDRETLDKIFAEKDTHYKKVWSAEKKATQEKQREVALKGKQEGSGGDTPAQAPNPAKSLRDVRKSLLSQFE